MEVKQYYYIDDRGYFANTGTGNAAHQAILDKMLTDDVAKYDIGNDIGKPIGITGVKQVLSEDKKTFSTEPQVFKRLLKPVEFTVSEKEIEE